MRRKVADIVIGHSEDFLKPVLRVADKWRQRFLPRLLKAMVNSQRLVVTEAVREVLREPGGFRQEYKSFSRHLNSDVWDDQELEMQRVVESRVGATVAPLTPIVVDDGDLSKPYASKMEFLGSVLDGDQERINPGYWSFESYVAEHPEAPQPLVNFPYSLADPQFPSRRHARREAYRRIARATGRRGVLIEDRGFDSEGNFEDLNEFGLKGLVRLVGNRTLMDSSGQSLGIVTDFVATWRLRFTALASGRWVDGEETLVRVAYDWLPVRLPSVEGIFYLIAVRRCQEPAEGGMYLLTTVPLLTPFDVVRMMRYYHHRWRVEDSIQFTKEELGIESVRTLNFRPLRRLLQVAYWIMGILSALRLRLTPKQLDELLHRFTAYFHRHVRLLHYRLLAAFQYILGSSG